MGVRRSKPFKPFKPFTPGTGALNPEGKGKNGNVPPVSTRWKKGCPSPNPAGRPVSLKREAEDILAEVHPVTKKTLGRRLLEMCARRALQGSYKHFELLWGYHEGRPASQMHLTGVTTSSLPTSDSDLDKKIEELLGRCTRVEQTVNREEKLQLLELLKLRGMTHLQRLRYVLDKQREEWCRLHPKGDYGAAVFEEYARQGLSLADILSARRQEEAEWERAHPGQYYLAAHRPELLAELEEKSERVRQASAKAELERLREKNPNAGTPVQEPATVTAATVEKPAEQPQAQPANAPTEDFIDKICTPKPGRVRLSGEWGWMT